MKQQFNSGRLLVGVLVFILMVIAALMITSAWPYQLNTSTGVLYDLNASNNATSNLTIYVYNQTFINQTNNTCYNCSYLIIFNVTAGNGTIYNVTEIDNKFLTIASFDAYRMALTYPYPSRAEYDILAARVNGLNDTVINKGYGEGVQWTISIIALLGVVAIGIYMYLLARSNFG